MKKVVFFCIFAFLSVGSFLTSQETKETDLRKAQDLYTEGIELHIRTGAGMANPFFAGIAELELRKIAGKIDVFAGGAYGSATAIGMPSPLPLFGSDGYQAHAGIAFRFAEKTTTTNRFFAVAEISRTANTVTNLGFYFDQPSHETHLINLDFRIEPTGNMIEFGFDDESFSKTYSLGNGSSFLIFPGYRYCSEIRYIIDGYMKNPLSMYMSFIVGPVFSPDFSKIGGMIDSAIYLGAIKNLHIYTAVSLGYIGRFNIPKGTILVFPDGTGDPMKVKDSGDAAIFGYMPMRVAIGAAWILPLASGGEK